MQACFSRQYPHRSWQNFRFATVSEKTLYICALAIIFDITPRESRYNLHSEKNPVRAMGAHGVPSEWRNKIRLPYIMRLEAHHRQTGLPYLRIIPAVILGYVKRISHFRIGWKGQGGSGRGKREEREREKEREDGKGG